MVSWSGPLIRIASEAHPLAIAFWRTAIASAVLVPAALVAERGLPRLGARSMAGMVAAGALLSLHFATWVASIDLTTVASSVLLVSTTPVWVGIAAFVMGERMPAKSWLGIGLAISGAAVVAFAPGIEGTSARSGNILALLGAVAGAGYFIAGRKVRSSVRIATYAAVVYSVCAVMLAAAALITKAPLTGFSAKTWLTVIAIGIGPQLIGHTTFNFLLADLEAWKVTVAVVGEPVGSALIAGWLFGEIPGPLVFPGGLLLLAGVGLAVGRRTAALPAQ